MNGRERCMVRRRDELEGEMNRRERSMVGGRDELDGGRDKWEGENGETER
jgi:hypothetical protein